MRKFRGKLINKYAEEWFYGDLINLKNKDGTIDYYIISEDYESKNNIIELGTCQSPKVEKETIGQSTGLKDKNEVEIYEGDIVRVRYIGEKGYENNSIIYDRGAFCANCSEDYHPLLNEINHCCEVIGNIHDNKELLEEK